MKLSSVLLILGSAFGLAGCVADMDSSSEQGDDVEAGEQTGVAEQGVTNGAINAACADSLTLRSSPGGATIGTMYTGPYNGISKFYVWSTDKDGWSYGYSYSLGRPGYAMAYYLTTNYLESGTPGQIGYNYACYRSDGTGRGGGIG
ncbi:MULTISPECIES: hypothetical protein [Sorangium]|uniref:SH3b domain-containing protein n=1 Tax=Sorangium cellulosum TaxID=56 RepID=A0A4P2QX10_SORCE|nr:MULTISPECIES: hypothetical protein [Sorangium]AUX35070.1 uncharacterized protein SOCE836_072580 [Sorangium cellulosum]WCQ94375.1 hypothetical protein NQZ70_07140 [Sorangium sp. Soce836]